MKRIKNNRINGVVKGLYNKFCSAVNMDLLIIERVFSGDVGKVNLIYVGHHNNTNYGMLTLVH